MKRISIALLAGFVMIAGSAHAANDSGWYAGGGIGWSQFETAENIDLLSSSATNQACLNGTINGYVQDPQDATRGCFTYFESGSSFDESVFGLDGFVGFQFTPALSLELQYVWFGEAERTDDVPAIAIPPAIYPVATGGLYQPPNYYKDDELSYEQQASIRSFNIAGRYHFAISPKWGLNVVGGWAFAKSTYSQSTDNIQPVDTGASWYRPPTEVERSKTDNGYLIGVGTTIDTTENTFLRMEYTYYGIDFDKTFERPSRLSLDVGYRF